MYIDFVYLSQGYEGSLLKVTSKNGKTASVSSTTVYTTNNKTNKIYILIPSICAFIYFPRENRPEVHLSLSLGSISNKI